MSDTESKKPVLSAEEQQIVAIKGAMDCAQGVLDILKTSVGLTVSNINEVHKYVAWLESISSNLKTDWMALSARRPKPTTELPVSEDAQTLPPTPPAA